MKRITFVGAIALALLFSIPSGSEPVSAGRTVAVSPNLVISQYQAGGTDPNDEFIEIKNIGSEPVDLNGHRVVYRSATGTNDVGPMAVWTTTTILQPGQYYLIASTGYDGGVTPDLTYNPTTCACSMGANGGGLAIRNGGQNTGTIIDSAAWGTATNIFIEGTPTAVPGNNNSNIRKESGCQDTDNNTNDFQNLIPAAARNTASAYSACSGGGTTLFAAMNASPTAVSPGGNIVFTVTVVPATTPPSTSINVSVNMQSIGGASNQQLFDDGTNGDQTAGDNVFTYQTVVSPETPGGQAPIAGAAVDGQARTAPVQVVLTINAPLPNEDPLLLGNPSNATPDTANENNYLMVKPQYTLSYNRSRATANWVAWRLASSWIGSTQRQDDFRPDPSLPADWYQVTSQDYSGSGFDRGHMCPSGDRTNSIVNNSATFLMTNIVPQLGANNQGPWEEFESYSRTLAGQGNELYIVSGVHGTLGTIASGRITVPQYTWKVVLIIPNGSDDLQRIGKGTRAFGIIVPNFAPLDINAPWRNFRVTVDAVENITGLDFFNAIPKITQEIIERRRDRL